MTGQHASMPTNAASNSASLRSRNSGSTTFNDAVKLEASRLSGDHCWLCETIEPDYAYVIGQKDTEVYYILCICH